jgi:hypothetical protein
MKKERRPLKRFGEGFFRRDGAVQMIVSLKMFGDRRSSHSLLK